jgi:heme/copper-type cytochrome/quinol oxidase subunit 3
MQIQKPNAVIDAVNLLWLSVALSAISFAYILVFPVDLAGAYPKNSAIPAAQFELLTKTISAIIPIIGILSVVYMAFIAYKISQGRNWARLWYLISFVLGIVFMLITFDQTFWGCRR